MLNFKLGRFGCFSVSVLLEDWSALEFYCAAATAECRIVIDTRLSNPHGNCSVATGDVQLIQIFEVHVKIRTHILKPYIPALEIAPSQTQGCCKPKTPFLNDWNNTKWNVTTQSLPLLQQTCTDKGILGQGVTWDNEANSGWITPLHQTPTTIWYTYEFLHTKALLLKYAGVCMKDIIIDLISAIWITCLSFLSKFTGSPAMLEVWHFSLDLCMGKYDC